MDGESILYVHRCLFNTEREALLAYWLYAQEQLVTFVAASSLSWVLSFQVESARGLLSPPVFQVMHLKVSGLSLKSDSLSNQWLSLFFSLIHSTFCSHEIAFHFDLLQSWPFPPSKEKSIFRDVLSNEPLQWNNSSHAVAAVPLLGSFISNWYPYSYSYSYSYFYSFSYSYSFFVAKWPTCLYFFFSPPPNKWTLWLTNPLVKVLLIQIKLIKSICIQVLSNFSLRDCFFLASFTHSLTLYTAFSFESRLIVNFTMLNWLQSVFMSLCLNKVSFYPNTFFATHLHLISHVSRHWHTTLFTRFKWMDG